MLLWQFLAIMILSPSSAAAKIALSRPTVEPFTSKNERFAEYNFASEFSISFMLPEAACKLSYP